MTELCFYQQPSSASLPTCLKFEVRCQNVSSCMSLFEDVVPTSPIASIMIAKPNACPALSHVSRFRIIEGRLQTAWLSFLPSKVGQFCVPQGKTHVRNGRSVFIIRTSYRYELQFPMQGNINRKSKIGRSGARQESLVVEETRTICLEHFKCCVAFQLSNERTVALSLRKRKEAREGGRVECAAVQADVGGFCGIQPSDCPIPERGKP